jgi:hypothetical protein
MVNRPPEGFRKSDVSKTSDGQTNSRVEQWRKALLETPPKQTDDPYHGLDSSEKDRKVIEDLVKAMNTWKVEAGKINQQSNQNIETIADVMRYHRENQVRVAYNENSEGTIDRKAFMDTLREWNPKLSPKEFVSLVQEKFQLACDNPKKFEEMYVYVADAPNGPRYQPRMKAAAESGQQGEWVRQEQAQREQARQEHAQAWAAHALSPEQRAQARQAMSPKEHARAAHALSPEQREQARQAQAWAALSPEEHAQAEHALSPAQREQARQEQARQEQARQREAQQ